MTDAEKRYPGVNIGTEKWEIGYSFDTMQDAEGWDRLIKNIIRFLGICLLIASLTKLMDGWLVILNYIGVTIGFIFSGISRFDYFKTGKQLTKVEVWG